MSLSRQSLVANLDDKGIREVVENGKRWIVAPAAILKQGILNGSKGALLYRDEENKKTAHLWDKIPLTVNHPFDPVTNAPLGAWDGDVVERQHIGETRKPHWVDGKTRVEAWFDAEATRRKAPEVYNSLMKRELIAVSTGLFTNNIEVSGQFNGTHYTAEARDHKPDHLAILPFQRGACHIDEGCGVGVTNATTVTPEVPTANEIAEVQSWWTKFVAFITNTPKHPINGKFIDNKGLSGAHATAGWQNAVTSCPACGKPMKECTCQKTETVKNDLSTDNAWQDAEPDPIKVQLDEAKAAYDAALALWNSKQGDNTVAKKLTPAERKTIVDGLITNCSCATANVWDESDRAHLDGMPDSKLQLLRDQRELATKNEFPFKKKGEPEEEEEEEEEEETENQTRIAGKKTATANKAKKPAAATFTPTALVGVMNTLNKVNQLTAHIPDATERQEMVANLLTKTDAELDMMVKLVGNRQPLTQNMRISPVMPVFGGGGGDGSTNNQTTDNSDPADVLNEERIDWIALARERGTLPPGQ